MPDLIIRIPGSARPSILTVGGRDHTIAVAGKRHRFEMHPVCGPAVLNAVGDPADRQPGPRHPFWTAVTLWHQQGRRVDANGLCIWEPEPEIPKGFRRVHLGGRHYRLVEDEPTG